MLSQVNLENKSLRKRKTEITDRQSQGVNACLVFHFAPVSPTDGRVFVHPDSPKSGADWMKGEICFSKLKLTNNRNASSGHVIINSMHKYQPRVHVMALKEEEQGVDGVVVSAIYPETQFIAVTAYQNTDVSILPFFFSSLCLFY